MSKINIIIGLVETEMKKEIKVHTSSTIEYFIQSSDNSDNFVKSAKLQELLKAHEIKKTAEEKINRLEQEIATESFIQDFTDHINKFFN